MGRGRQKAKQTKVARQLKYFSPETDYARLQRELGSTGHGDADEATAAVVDDAEGDDEFDDEDEDEDDEYADWSPGSGR